MNISYVILGCEVEEKGNKILTENPLSRIHRDIALHC